VVFLLTKLVDLVDTGDEVRAGTFEGWVSSWCKWRWVDGQGRENVSAAGIDGGSKGVEVMEVMGVVGLVRVVELVEAAEVLEVLEVVQALDCPGEHVHTRQFAVAVLDGPCKTNCAATGPRQRFAWL